jgi:hypothetical protein
MSIIFKRKIKILTVSGSFWLSINAENSTSLNLEVAIDLPSHGGNVGGGCRSELMAVAGFPAALAEYPVCANGLMLQ